MAARLDTSPRPLAATLREAVAREIITEQQARQIADVQARVAESPTTRAADRVRPAVVEALGYVGGALVTLATAILVEQFWADLVPWGRVALFAATAGALLGAGALVRAHDGPVERLRGFLWVLSAVAVAGTVAVALTEYTALEESELVLATSVVAAAYGLVLWWVRPASLQQLAVFAATVAAATAGIASAAPSWEDASGLAVWGVGTAWASAAWTGWIRPRRTGLVVGAAAAVLGPVTVPDGRYGWILIIALMTAGLLVAVSITADENVLLGLGIVGIVVYVPRIVFEYFGDTVGAPVSLLIVGVVLVAVALTLTRVGTRWRRRAEP